MTSHSRQDFYTEALRGAKSRRVFTRAIRRASVQQEPLPVTEPVDEENGHWSKDPQPSLRGHHNSDVLGGRRTALTAQGTVNAAGWKAIIAESITVANLPEDGEGDDDMQIHGEQGHSFKIPFYSPPVQRQKWGDDQMLPHINWGDLFFDLFYVAAAYNLGGLLISALTPELWFHGLIYFIGIFGPLFIVWESKLVYDARFTTFDYAHRVVEVIRVVFLSWSVLHIKTLDLMVDPKLANTIGFILGLFLECLVRISLEVELFMVGKGDVEAIKNDSKRKLVLSYIPLAGFYCVALIVASVQFWGAGEEDASLKTAYGLGEDGSTYVHYNNMTDAGYGGIYSSYSNESKAIVWSVADVSIILCLSAYVLNLAFTTFRKTILLPKAEDFRKENVPSNIDFCIHRYGEWTMLMLGESVLSLLIVDTVETVTYYFVACVGVLTVIIFQALHFESEPSHADHHALWRNIQAGVKYSNLLQLFSMALIAFGASYKVMLKMICKEAEYAVKDALEGEYGGQRWLMEDESLSRFSGQLHQILAPSSFKITEQAAASLFCGALTITLITSELMSFSHEGCTETVHRMFKVNSGVCRIQSVFLLLFKFSTFLFAATLSIWQTDPRWITLLGFIIVMCMAVARVVRWNIFHRQKNEEEHANAGSTNHTPVSLVSTTNVTPV